MSKSGYEIDQRNVRKLEAKINRKTLSRSLRSIYPCIDDHSDSSETEDHIELLLRENLDRATYKKVVAIFKYATLEEHEIEMMGLEPPERIDKPTLDNESQSEEQDD